MSDIRLSTKGLLLIAASVAGAWFLFRLWPVFVVIATAFIFMAAALPYVDWMVRRGIPRAAAALLLLAAVLLLLAGMGALVLPALVTEAMDIHESLPEDAARLDRTLEEQGITLNLEERAREVDWGQLVSGQAAIDYGQRAIYTVVGLVSVVVITVYLLIDAPKLNTFIYGFVQPGREPVVERLMTSLRVVVGGYIRGQLITSAAIGVFTSGLMFALGLSNPLAFGVLAAFADVIPLVGATLAIVPAVLVAFQESPTKAGILLVALIGYQQFEDRVLIPRVYGRTLNLPPIIVLTAVLVGAELFGITGVLIALPAAAVARVLLDFYLGNRALEAATHASPRELLAPDPPGPEKQRVSDE
ncbi:MAG: AI-2E family transporter [Tepidiformaceae bacterium]